MRGGAYGVGFQAQRTGALRFYSYRDPHLDETLARFAAAPAWLRAFDPAPKEFDGYVVSTVAGFDSPQKARALINRQDSAYFAGRTPEDRLAARARMVAADRGALAELADVIEAACAHDARCVFGNRAIIEGAKAGFEVIDLLNA